MKKIDTSVKLFGYTDYKTYLKDQVQQSGRGFITQLAAAAPCQRSYLSKVIHDNVHLTTDQTYNISFFLGHNSSEQDYFFSLVEYARASTKTYRDHLTRKLKSLRQENEDLSKILDRKVVNVTEKEAFYYSHFLPSCLHILSSLPQYQTAAEMGRALTVPESLVQQLLDQLENHGLVKKEKSKYLFVGESLHVSKNSPYVTFHHQNWRQQAIQASQKPNDQNIHYTNIQSMSIKAFLQLKDELLATIHRATSIAGPSEGQVVVGYLADLFLIVDSR